ncbi:MAG: hypothetical protein ACRDAW_01430 [Metamycoplasmataceae bacterium]
MIKKNKKKTLLGLGVGVTTASAIVLPALLLGLNQESLNLNNKTNKNYVDSAWKDTKISDIGTSPILWNNNTVFAVNYEGKAIKDILDVYNYGQNNTILKLSTSINPSDKFEINLFQGDPVYNELLNNSVQAAGFINLQASKINLTSLQSRAIDYKNFTTATARKKLGATHWDIQSFQLSQTDANDRLVKVLIRKPFGTSDTFAQKTYSGSTVSQGLTYITQGPIGMANIGTMPELYTQPGNGSSINPANQPLLNMETGANAPAANIKFMVLDVIGYMDVNNVWRILPNFQNTSTQGVPQLTGGVVDETKFDKNLTAQEALNKVINDKSKFLNLNSINAPKFWDETSTINAQYDNQSGKIKITFNVRQEINTAKQYNQRVFDNNILNSSQFKTAAGLDDNNGGNLIKTGTRFFEYEISGFRSTFDVNAYLIEKTGVNKNVLPSSITNVQAPTYVNIYQDGTLNNSLPSNFELTVTGKDNALGQAVFSIYNKTSKQVISSIIIKGFKTNNISKPVTDPIELISDKNGSGISFNTASVKPYDHSWLVSNPTLSRPQWILDKILIKQTMIRPISIPYDNGFIVTSTNVPSRHYSNINPIMSVSREGKINSATYFWSSADLINIIDVTYDSFNNQVIAWFLKGNNELVASITTLDPNTGILNFGNSYAIETYDSTEAKEKLASNIAIVPVPNINKTEYWIVNRALKDNNLLTPTSSILNNNGANSKWLTRARFNSQNTAPDIKRWGTDFSTKLVAALMNRDILVNPNPSTTTAKFTAASKFKIHNISSNFINGNEYLGVDLSISFNGTTYENGNNIHHVLLKISEDPTNPLTESSIMNSTAWTMEYVYSASVAGFASTKFSDVSLISTIGSSILNFNNPTNASQTNAFNKKGWFSHGSFYSQDKTYNAITTVLQSSFIKDPNPIVISGTTRSSATMDFSIPTGYFSDSSYNNGAFQVLQQPYWQKDKVALNIRNSGFTFNDNAGTSASINDPTANGTEFKEISFGNTWASNITTNNGGASFTSKTLGTIDTNKKGPFNAINISKDSNGEEITSILYTSTEAKLIVDHATNNVIPENQPSQLRIKSTKANNVPIWNTKDIKTSVLDAQNTLTFTEIRTLSPKFKTFIKKQKVFANYIVDITDLSLLPLEMKGNPVWNATNTEVTVQLSFPTYYVNGVLTNYNADTSTTFQVKIRNVVSTTLNVLKTNLEKITFTGNTKDIVINNEDQALVSGNGDPTQTALIKTNVEILYNLNSLSATNWYTKADFIAALAASKKNFFLDDIKTIQMKYSVKSGSDYTVSDGTEHVATTAQISGLIPFMHMDTYYAELVKVGASADGIGVTGTDSSNITAINWPFSTTDAEFTKIIGAGIKFQWTNKQTPGNSDWIDYNFAAGATNKIDLGNPPYLAVKIVAGNNNVTFDMANDGKVVIVTPKNIKILINLTEADLINIVFGGNTKDLTIDTSAITNLASLSSIVDLQFSVGWDLVNNVESEPNDEKWYSQGDLINRLKLISPSLFIKRTGYPVEFPNTFKLKARFIIKPGITNAGNYIFPNNQTQVNHLYTDAQKLTIKNYIDISALQTKLEFAKITFGVNDRPDSVTELTIASVTPEDKAKLKTLGIELKFAFGPSTNPPVDSAYTHNWNDKFAVPVNLGQPPTIWLKFVVLDASKTITEISNPSWTHKAVEPQIEKPKFIDLLEANLTKTVLTGSTIALGINETASLVPGNNTNTQDEVTANVEIIYNINNLKLDVTNAAKVWFTKTELDAILPNYPINIFLSDLQNIKTNYRVKATSAGQGWRISDTTEQQLAATNVNSFVHTLVYFNALKDKRVTITGTATNITNVIFPEGFDKTAFKILESNGIVLQWTTNNAPTTDADWKDLVLDDLTTYPTNIGVTPYLAMRITTNQLKVITSTEVDKVLINVTPLSITIVYTVNSQTLITNLKPTGNTRKINDLDETSSLTGAYPDYAHLEIRYKIGTTKPIELIQGKEWYSFTELKAALLNYKDLILPSERQITAKYFLKEGTPPPNPNPPSTSQPYVGFIIEYVGNMQEATLDITNFKSFVDVTNALANLTKNETTFAPGDSTEKITAIIKTGLTNEEAALLFGTNLNLRGDLSVDLNPTTFPFWWQPGQNNNLPKSLPNKDTNGKPVLMWRFALTSITDITFDADVNTTNVSTAVQLNVNLPVQILIQPADYTSIKAAIGGNTKMLILDEAVNTAAIQAVVTREKLPADIPLQILYAIGGGTSLEGLPLDETDPTKTWFTLTEFKTLLAAKTTDFNTNQIRAKFFIDPSYSNAGQTYILSTEMPETLQTQDLTAAAKVKIFINKANYETLPAEITAVGSSDDLTIIIPDGLKPAPGGPLSPGLELVWSIVDNPQLSQIEQTNNATWTSVLPTKLEPTIKKLSVAYRVKPAYTLEQTANRVYSIDTSKIFTYINVQNVWLDQIIFSGNLFDATIDENTFKNNLTSIPGGEFVQIQYTVDNKEWLLQTEFIAKLKTLEGALDANNFILLKNKVKARYSIDPTKFVEYRLKVDGVGIINTAFVEDPTLFRPILSSAANNGFKGYINLSKVPDFDSAGFKITGTNAIPLLEFTTAGAKLAAQFAPYQDPAIVPFEIYYTTKKGTGNGEFVMDEAHKLFGPTGFKTTGFDPISNSAVDQFFGIKIIAKTGYDVYKNNVLQNGGFSFSVSLDIKTIKDNPFGTAKLVVKFEGYQGEGKVNLWYDGGTAPELASTVLDRDPDLVGQYYVEFHISNTVLSDEELNKLPEDSWIKVGAPDGQGGTIQFPSNLKVGQFVAGRIRMKESSKFEIKDIKLNDSLSTRVINLMINQSQITIATPQLRNNEYSNQFDLIDGDIYINKINVERDNKDNYLGVDLILQVRTEFYTRPDGTFILDNNGLPIVKRVPTLYYDVIGPETGSPLTEVRIYYTDSTKTIPSDPLETGPTVNLDLTEVPDSFATFIYNLNSGAVNAKQGILFQNQTFSIAIKAKKDFILDTSTPKPFNQKITNAKYPLNINPNLVMSVQIPDPIKYETTGEATPQNGKAFITADTNIKIQFIEDNGNTSITLQGEEAVKRLTTESQGRLRIRVTLKRKNKDETFFYNGTNLNLSQLQDLSNGDRILIALVPVDPNFVLIGPSSSIASWIVNELEIAAPNTDIFKDLKIVTNINSENPIWDGQGTFFVAVKTGSGNPPEDLSDELLNPNDAVPGQTRFHFVYRVWDINKKVKVDWTPDKTRITSLKNGEKVEWRLKSQSGEPLATDYYNTVAHTSANKKFAVINVDKTGAVTFDPQFGLEGNGNKYVEGTEIYPETQGFTINGLVEGEIVLEGNLLQNIEAIKLTYTGTNGAGSFSVNNPTLAEELLAKGIIISWYRNGQLISPDQSIAMLSNGDVITYKLTTTSPTIIIKNNITNSYIVSGLIESSNFISTIATAIGVSAGILTILVIAAPLTYRKLIKNKLEGKRSKRG